METSIIQQIVANDKITPANDPIGGLNGSITGLKIFKNVPKYVLRESNRLVTKEGTKFKYVEEGVEKEVELPVGSHYLEWVVQDGDVTIPLSVLYRSRWQNEAKEPIVKFTSLEQFKGQSLYIAFDKENKDFVITVKPV